MNLNEVVLSVLSETETMDASAVIREIEAMDWPEQCPRAFIIVNTLESMAKTGEVAMSWAHRSLYRKRTDRELGEWLAVKAGNQRELL